jgi:competence protein ComFC
MYKPKVIFETILDFLFPKGHSEKEAEKVTAEMLLEKLAQKNKIDAHTYALFNYGDKEVKNMIWALKYRKNRIVTKTLSNALYDFLAEEFSDMTVYSNLKEPILIPIPISKKRLYKRGFNQTELLAKEFCIIADKSFCTLRTDILKKIKDTPSQTSLHRNERLKNIIGAFDVKRAYMIKGRDIILLDDVTTTGATLNEARITLLQSGAKKVICVAVGH